MYAGDRPILDGTLLLVHGSADPGGTELQTLRLARFLRDRGVTVASLFDCAPGPILDRYRQEGFRIHHTGGRLYPDRATREWVAQVSPDAIYLFGLRTNVRWRLWSRRICPSASVWGAIRGLTNTARVRWRRMLLDRATLGFLDGYVSNSRYVIGRLVRWGFPPAKLHFVRNFVEFGGQGTRPGPVFVERRIGSGPALELPSDVPVLTYVANVRPVKGHRLLTPVLQLLKARGLAFRCLLVGALPAGDTVLNEFQRAGLEEHVFFAGFRDDARAILAGSDLLVFPSLMEGCPNAILEAMHAGLPIVASPWGEQRYLVEEGLGGFLADPRQPGEFADRIAQLLADRELRVRLGDHNRRRVGELFDRSSVEAENLALVERMLRRPALTSSQA